MTNKRVLGFASGGLLGLACLFFILSNALPSWGVSGDTELGLWRACLKGTSFCINGPSSCSGVPSEVLGVCLKLMMARTFLILACLFSGFGTILLLFIGYTQIGNPTYVSLGRGLAAASFLCGIVGVSLGINWVTHDTGFGWGAASFLGILAFILSLVSAIIAAQISKD